MTIDQKYEARLSALRLWARDVAARGFIAPSEQDLAAIAIAKSLDAPGVDAGIVHAWQGAITTLLKQVAFNIADPHSQLGSEYDVPESEAGLPAQPAAGGEEVPAEAPARALANARATAITQMQQVKVKDLSGQPNIEASKHEPESSAEPSLVEQSIELLKAWRTQAVDDARPFASQLKDRDLRNVANGKRDLTAVQSQLPGVAQGFAHELVELLASINPPMAELDLTEADSAVPEHAAHLPADPAPPTRRAARSAASEVAWEVAPLAPVQRERAALETGATVAPADHAEGAEIDPALFAAYDFIASGIKPETIKVAKTLDGSRRYSWAPGGAERAVKIYRLISGDETAPYTPDQADVIAITEDGHAVDARVFSTAVRYVQVWCHAGRDRVDAMNSQPVLHATVEVVAEVPAVDIREDEGRIIGQWTALPGTQKVQIFRIPANKAAFSSGDPAYRIHADGTNLGGFVDAQAERGAAYVYQVHAEAAVYEQTLLSAPSVVPITVSAVLLPVDDLNVTVNADEDADTVLVDLRWRIPPGGRVDIYRTATPPAAGIELKPLEEATLEQGGLRPEFRLAHPIEPENGTAAMLNVPWPVQWTRTYFTPVTVLDGRAHVGASRVSTRPTRIRNAKVVERVDSQILTFEWPAGADAVMVYRGPAGQGPENALAGQPLEISHSAYNQRGGMYFPSNLPAEGCDLHLVPVSFEAGNRVAGSVTTVNYPWIMRVGYRVAPRKAKFTGKVTGFTVVVDSHTPNAALPGFMLVYNHERLPLTASDGQPLNMMRDMDGAEPATRVFTPHSRTIKDPPDTWKTDPETWNSEVRAGTGYIRLFPQVPMNVLKQMAVLDPGVKDLTLNSRGNSGWGPFGGR
ncbi:hypothetical protein [Arthrobacter sp.]|uniref:hypothetical protein n=1 Tax=Arthrobacter sp. TaxID=1667 RepID=UPI0026DF20F3|nr:hypothetical protein [Arthrobacter sp.]MDO5752291.1 hypothetical protein [Arthrobacter sp.]